MKTIKMKITLSICLMGLVLTANAQINDANNVLEQKLKTASDLAFQGNSLLEEGKAIAAEMEFRKALSTQPDYAVGSYNLAHSYYKNGTLNEALFRLQEAVENATSKVEKHRAFHNIGNVLMNDKRCKEAVEAYKNALRNNPMDEESRYNLGLAKECAEQQKEENNEDDKKDDKQDKNDQQDQQDQNKDDQQQDKNKENQDDGDKDKKEGDNENDDKGQPKDDKQDPKDEGDTKENNNQPQQPKPQPGQLSPQQVKNLLEAMQNQEEKVQEKINASKQKGVKIKTEKDW